MPSTPPSTRPTGMSYPWDELLPTRMEVGGVDYEIRSDYRAILDICAALSDPELDGQERAVVALTIFYPGLSEMPPEHYQEARDRCLCFIRGGMEEDPRARFIKLVDWEQDFSNIVAPINRILGQEVRAVKYMHWWTFLAAFYEIGDCTFAQIVRVRDRLARGKPLDKLDREWYRNNQHLVDFKRKYTSVEDDLAKSWGF